MASTLAQSTVHSPLGQWFINKMFWTVEIVGPCVIMDHFKSFYEVLQKCSKLFLHNTSEVCISVQNVIFCFPQDTGIPKWGFWSFWAEMKNHGLERWISLEKRNHLVTAVCILYNSARSSFKNSVHSTICTFYIVSVNTQWANFTNGFIKISLCY